ncbi:MAG: ATPase [Chloroflexi bacterium]|nr:ATPase [Chloroflexota bacterium]
MDILHLVDRLEELFNESRPIPFTNNVVVDEDRMLDLIDQMRVAIPEEVKKAQKLMAERDRTLAQAQEEAARTIRLAREKSEGMIERDAIVEAAQARSEQILEQAKLDAEATRREADEYVLEALTNLEIEMERSLNQVRNGIRALQQTHAARNTPPARAAAPAPVATKSEDE